MVEMAGAGRGSGREFSTAVCVVKVIVVVMVFCVVFASFSVSGVKGASVSLQQESGARRVPLYVQKARQYLERQKSYERTMQARMKTLAQALDTFSTQLYLQHIADNTEGNVLISPFSAYVSLAMMLTATQGKTKREVLTALTLSGEGRGIHTSLQRALKSLLDDDTDEVNDDLSADMDLSDMQGDDAGIFDLSYKDLESIIRNDYLMDSSISYNTGQRHIKYSTAIKTGRRDYLNDQQSEPVTPDPDLFVRAANGMFHSEEVALSQHFSNRLVSLYGAPPMAMQQDQPEMSVNLWVDAVTRGMVPDMLGAGSVSQHTLLVLVSALSFWGAWETNFEEKETIELEFETLEGDKVIAPCMYQTGNYSVKTVDELGAKVLELPYANTRYSLYVFLPRSASQLKDLERSLKTHSLHSLLHDMPRPDITIVLLPRFHLRSRVSLKAELKNQGVRRLFKKRQAYLRRMTDEDESLLYVNDFFQYAALEVNEGIKSDAGKSSITIGSGWDSTTPSSTDNPSNSSHHSHITDSDDDDGIDEELDDNSMDEKLPVVNEDEDFDNEDSEYEDYEYDEYYDYENYDYEDYEEEDGLSSSNYFIAEKPFLFVVKDKQYDLVLFMGRVTNPLP